ncbi:hypothetical protein HS088_TW18G00454 [Tripterygium wilfordii]|uniref:F-box domain-containing protein n=1 Tax=Tripterygium wilfordii TaxID=458696 RepID=A0A7J7CCB7_TRIWF|nr:F-box/kelch-repeat protein At3g61590-like [Tripterygium wilfordii]XP_038684545.1 F-box/kelch-repeat protein At3g61590-like [Tripterygium wilfordii]KAF5731769.1 hypothetical protein HS088_TW18G00454 [Tripterygium wilfordii]
MRGKMSHANYCHNYQASECREENKGETVSADSNLSNDVLEKILVYLPIGSIFSSSSVCKRWHGIVSSERFLQYSDAQSRKPWYFMFTSKDEQVGYAYDPSLGNWYGIELPFILTPNWFIASSHGLVCFRDNNSGSDFHVCNPIKKQCKKIVEPPGLGISEYGALAISVSSESHGYTISIVKSKKVLENPSQWDISIHIYDSKTVMWVTSLSEVLIGWRGGNESVICDSVLYILIYSTDIGARGNRHGLITYNLSSRSSNGLLIDTLIPEPISLTCGRLTNLKEKLVMVGGIGKPDKPGIITGVRIWVLNGKDWQVAGRMSHDFFQGFGELDDVFASSGMVDHIYIQSYGKPLLVVFDMNQKKWKRVANCPLKKRYQLQLFSGFCLEPKLAIAP